MKKEVLITDVDNTLFDWIEIWHVSFSAMMERVSKISGIELDKLYPDVKKIHEKHGTSEYAYLLEELPILLSIDEKLRHQAIIEGNQAFADARLHATALYTTVFETLSELSNSGIKIVAFTESFGVYTAYRFKACNLDGLIDILYSPEKHHISKSEYAKFSHSHDADHILERTVVRHTPSGVIKPNAELLKSITEDLQVPVEKCVYVGDSLMKDIAMAQSIGMLDVHASYGLAQHRDEYSLLKKVTHWPDSMVTKESEISTGEHVKPNFVLNNHFNEILNFFG